MVRPTARRGRYNPYTRVSSYGGHHPLRASEEEILLESFTPDALIACVSSKPRDPLDAGISIPDEPIKTTVLSRTLSSSLGLLDTLPIELMRMIFNSSDFQSLARFAQVCHQAKTLVDSLSSYRDMTKHASSTLIALSQSKLITLHAADTLHAALLADKCISCHQYGPFLFLLTCERCCYCCLKIERSLWAITTQMAGRGFGLSPKHLAQIPMMITIPGQRQVDRNPSRRKVKLFSLKEVEKLGISVHGSREAMIRVAVLNAKGLWLEERCHAQWLAGTTVDWVDRPTDNYFGAAFISFPQLQPNGELVEGLWCSGCRDTAQHFRQTGILNTDTPLLMSHRHLQSLLEGMERQERPRSEFLKHIRSCKGARDLVRKMEILRRRDETHQDS